MSLRAIAHRLYMWVYLGHVKYARGINHWAASSTQLSDCVVEAGTAADVAVIVCLLIIYKLFQLLNITIYYL